MRRGFTEEEFQKRLKENYGDKFETLSPYINAKSEIKVKCNVCGTIIDTIGDKLIRGKGCKTCDSLKKTKTHDTFMKDINEYYLDRITIENKYVDAKHRIDVKCNVCNHRWSPFPKHLSTSRIECPICTSKRLGFEKRKQHYEFVEQISKLYGDKYTIIGEYIKADKKIDVKCNKCDIIWSVKPNNILGGKGCPECSQSKGEIKISEILNKIEIDHIKQHSFDECRNKNRLSFDFYLPDFNCCIEYDGIQHFKPIEYFGGEKMFVEVKNHDEIKNKYCLENNITLVRIPYNKFKNIEIIINDFLKTIK